MSTAIHWFRRDLRITDNTALNAAIAAHTHVVPIHVLSAWEGAHQWCGAARQEFLCGCLASLAKNLEAKGGRLLIRQGAADAELEKLIRECGASAIYFNRDPDPFGRAMEIRVAAVAARLGVSVHACKDHAMHERDEVLTGDRKPFRVFTPYSRAWRSLEKADAAKTPARISTPPDLASLPLPTLATWKLKSDARIVEAGESAARKRLGRFLDGPVLRYAERRDIPAGENTSRLSQDFRFGLLSIREVYASCIALAKKTDASGRRGMDIFVNELVWREFYMQVLWHSPEVLAHEFQPKYRDLMWRSHWRPGERDAGEAFERWCAGQTGFPIVDAGMRELRATGFMHNRLRMITAMFLTKDLHIWWMHGESWFMRCLVDGEIASNNGGWQWSASTGTDAAPYFRIQNPWTQGSRFDPDGEYIRRWIPELRDVRADDLHRPPHGGESLAKGYSSPMLNHTTEREFALKMFAR